MATQYGELQGPSADPSNSSIPPQAIGTHDNGRLINAVALPSSGEGFRNHHYVERVGVVGVNKMNIWGTTLLINLVIETSAYLHRVFQGVPLSVSDISMKNGGRFVDNGHLSHQNGLDVDIGYPLNTETPDEDPFPNFIQNKKVNSIIDVQRFWYILKMLSRRDDVILVFVDSPVKKVMCKFAKSVNEFPKDENDINFQALNKLQSWEGHNNHFHVRLQCPTTSPQCRRALPVLPVAGAGC